MKIFGFEIRKFEKTNTTVEMIETWCVKWQALHMDIIGKGAPRTNIVSFITKEGAKAYAKELQDARKMLGDKGWGVSVYRQEVPTNAN